MDEMTTLQNEALNAATEHIRGQRKKAENYKLKIVCLTVALCVAMICASMIGCFAIYSQQQTIIEQQYALNMQYAGLMDLLSGAEVTETTTNEADSGDGGTAVAGENNTVVWGNMNGESEIDENQNN